MLPVFSPLYIYIYLVISNIPSVFATILGANRVRWREYFGVKLAHYYHQILNIPGHSMVVDVDTFHFSMEISGTDWLEVPTICIQAFVRGYTPKIWPNIWYSTPILGSWNSHWILGIVYMLHFWSRWCLGKLLFCRVLSTAGASQKKHGTFHFLQEDFAMAENDHAS